MGRKEESRKGMIEEKVEEGRKEDRWNDGKEGRGGEEERNGRREEYKII